MDNNTNNSMNNYYTNNNQYGNYNEVNNNSFNQNNNFNQENSFNQNSNINQNNKKKKINKKLFLIIGIVLIAVLILIFFVFKGRKSYPNTVSQNDTLKAYELDGIYDFEANVLSLKDNYSISTYFDDYNGVVIEFKIKNISKQDLKFSLLSFYLLDDNGNKVDSASLMSQENVYDETNKLDFSSSISSGETVSGYVYFYDYDEDISLKDVSKIRIDVPKVVEKNGDILHIEYSEYFIELN